MGRREKQACLEAARNRYHRVYHRAKRADKGKILDEFCWVCGYQRKYPIWLLSCKGLGSLRQGTLLKHQIPIRITHGIFPCLASWKRTWWGVLYS